MNKQTASALNKYLDMYYRLGRLEAGIDSSTYDDSQSLVSEYRAAQVAWCAAQACDEGITFDEYMVLKSAVVSRLVAERRAYEKMIRDSE